MKAILEGENGFLGSLCFHLYLQENVMQREMMTWFSPLIWAAGWAQLLQSGMMKQHYVMQLLLDLQLPQNHISWGFHSLLNPNNGWFRQEKVHKLSSPTIFLSDSAMVLQ